MTWDKIRNAELKEYMRQLENAACDCDVMAGYSCQNHEIANKLKQEIVKEIEKARYETVRNEYWSALKG